MPLSSTARALLALLTFALPPNVRAGTAPAIPTQPEGWTLQAGGGAIVMSSPLTAAGEIVLLVISKPAPLAGSPSPATTARQFESMTQAHAGLLGKLIWRQGVTLEDSLLRDAVTIEDADGHAIHGYAFAYVTPQGLQTVMIYWPDPLTAASPSVAQALDHVAALWRVGFTYDGTTSQVTPLPESTPPVTASNTPQ